MKTKMKLLAPPIHLRHRPPPDLGHLITCPPQVSLLPMTSSPVEEPLMSEV